ncbi:DUF4124 domain-containing protein [Actimicrobium sp. CCC2.4]|uniref:DUF4124 domain-containing protein n=1 Tax=Actimicrobium sp. CCC2.4 TaxID=3048606 RepID=UPI002AC967C5|nr:DUF4124 domain-containing protein [Actimicrobium sp. CCC2.4]MEB0136991.1 DUF4124 domain-containing protein [Actimicrobium sp. CCC2.4]WPX32762.1 DUF4124 domain-containing protein [Actimicrobium sp. CCC2.4]
MPALTRTLLMLVLATVPGLVGAQIYVCKDSAGRTMTADRPIPECATRAMRELGNNGVVLREIPAPLTVAQREQLQRDKDKLKAENDARLELRRRDAAILERFRSEAEIEAARKRAVADVNEKMRQERNALAQADKELKEAQAEATLATKKNVVPVRLARKVEQAQGMVKAGQELMQSHQLELLKVDTWFDDTLQRYRELTGVSPAR